jgi:hypothetical protein
MFNMKKELITHAEQVSAKSTERLIKEKTQSEMLLEGRS